jgi:hypothetical protein
VYRDAAQPFVNTVGEGLELGLGARQTTIELGHAGALIEERLTVLGRPVSAHASQETDYGCLVL